MNEAIAHELRRLGVDAVFGVTGEDTIKLGVELGRLGAREQRGRGGVTRLQPQVDLATSANIGYTNPYPRPAEWRPTSR